LDFIKNYMGFLASKRKRMDNLVRRLDGGLLTLKRASEDTKELSETLAVQNKEIAEKSVVVAELIRSIGEKSA
jgi:predicted DCC family thiol-disulfide oxidoreductase YuxK